MITRRFQLAALVAFVAFAICCPAALSQPKPITACGTTIGTPGSYVATANLTSASTAVPCINVTASGVTIDLGGFVLTGIGGKPGIAASAAGALSISACRTTVTALG